MYHLAPLQSQGIMKLISNLNQRANIGVKKRSTIIYTQSSLLSKGSRSLEVLSNPSVPSLALFRCGTGPGVPEAFQGNGGESRKRGIHNGGGELREKGNQGGRGE